VRRVLAQESGESRQDILTEGFKYVDKQPMSYFQGRRRETYMTTSGVRVHISIGERRGQSDRGI
jgi:hypothetical protein